jgi:KUP system potassium uptake protein
MISPAMSEIPAPEDALPVQGKTKRAALVLGALGIVFGDIGTSPLYALRECFAPERGMTTSAENVLGVVSLLFWTLSLVVCVKYLVFVLRADNKGEGGILALVSLVSSKVREANKAKAAGLLAALAILGAALLYSDGIITPSISVLSAVEGLEILAPGLKSWVAPIAIVILFCLFPLQSKGTAGVARLFGPLLALWFAVIGLLGLSAVVARPAILQALSPVWALRLILREGPLSFGILGSVFLAMTGAEVLYADLGHFGPKPIRQAWFSLVYPALFLNYMGQGAYLLGHPGEVANLFYRLAPSWATIPLVVLATAATVIASQAVISGSFSLASQSVQLGYWPRIEVRHTSKDRIGQVYVPFINGFLMVGTIGLVLIFKESGRLANAYGIAVSATMLITTFLMIYVATHIWKVKPLAVLPLALVFLVIDTGFFVSNATKIVSGGWIVVALALAFFLLMKTWQDGRALFRRRMQVFRVEPRIFADSLALEPPLRVPGSAVFLTGDPNGVPKALLHNLKHNRVLHELTVIASIRNVEQPFVDEVARVRKAELSPGLWHLVIDYGFSETPDIPAALSRAKVPGLDPMRSAYFVGRESLALKKKGGGMAFWRKRLFDFMFENALDATAFFHLPPNNVIEIGSQTVL